MTMRKGGLVALTLVAIAVVGSVWAAGSDYFLKIDTVDGESDDSAHPDWIQIESWSFGASNPILWSDSPAGGSGRSRGKVSFSDLSITKQIDKSTPLLAVATCEGDTNNTLGEVHLELQERTATGTTQTYYVVTLSDVLVSSFQSNPSGSSSGGERPTESISLNFTKIEWSYQPQSGAAAIKAGWDLATNKKL